MKNLLPWNRRNVPASVARGGLEQEPFLTLHREINRLFGDVMRGFDVPSMFGGNVGWPNIEVSETDKEIKVSAEVPGLAEKDIEILLQDGVLTLRGEKRSETEDKDRQFSERFYGRFERSISVGSDIDEDKINATFKDGVVSVTLPKTAKSQAAVKRIAVKKGA